MAGKLALKAAIRSARVTGLRQDLASHSSATRTATWATTICYTAIGVAGKANIRSSTSEGRPGTRATSLA